MKAAFQRYRFAATGRWAVSIRTYSTLVFPFGFLTAIERTQFNFDVSISKAATIALGGELVCALYLFLAQALLLGNRRKESQPLWRCVFVWFSAGLVRGFFTACNGAWSFGFDYAFEVHVLPSASYTGVTMGLIAFYFGSIERKRIQIKALEALGNVLEQEKQGLAEIERVKLAQAQTVLEQQLLPQVSQLQVGIGKALSQENGITKSEDLQHLYKQSLEVGNSLESQKVNYSRAEVTQSKRSARGDAFSYWSALIPRVLSIRISFILMVIGSFAGQFARNGFEGAKVGFIGAIFLTLYLFPLSWIIKRNLRFKAMAYLFGYIGAFAVQAFYNLLQPKLGFYLNYPYEPWYSGLKTLYGVYIASVIATLITSVEGTFKGIDESGKTLRDSVESMAIQNIEIERSLLESQFGTLQGKIAGVTMALHLMNSMESVSEEKKSELLSGANELLKDSLVTLNKLQDISK